MSSSGEIDELQTDASYYRDRIALLRAKLYRWGLRPNAHLRQRERNLEQTEECLREERLRSH